MSFDLVFLLLDRSIETLLDCSLELSKNSLLTLFSLFLLFKISENGFLVVNSTVFRSFEPPRFMRVVAVELIEDVALDDFM